MYEGRQPPTQYIGDILRSELSLWVSGFFNIQR
jgi:hypothetical protein